MITINFKNNNIFLVFVLLFLFSGCSVTNQVIGEYHLQSKNYDDGYSHFKEKVNLEDTASNHYYYARFLIVKENYKEAISHLKKAIQQDPKKSLYFSWLGVAYGNIKQYDNERKSYLKAISLDKKNLQALTYLAHNYFDKKEYKKALEFYNKVLKLSAENQYALYNRSLVLGKLKRVPEEILSWKEYLSYYPSGLLAKKAVKQLNSLNDFSYKNHLIGFKTITLKNITFEPFSSKITSDSYSSLDVLGAVLEKNKLISIHVLSYQLNNKKLAKEKAISIRNYISKKFEKVDRSRLKLSWFGEPRVVNKNRLNEDINFITHIKK